jgi:hypothetical protein
MVSNMAYIYEDPRAEKDKKELKKYLEQMRKDISTGKYLEDELDRIWNKIKMDAVAMCPKDTGSLASTIRVVDSEVADASLGTPDKSIEIFGKAIIAGDLMRTNPKTHSPIDYAQLVHDGYIRSNGVLYVGIPFLTYALALNDSALQAAIDRALQKLGKEFEQNATN